MFKILVVDDEKNIADGVRFTIEENFGDEVSVSARYGVESAKNYVMQNVVDILVCDINMPKLSGLDLCEQLLIDYPDLKIIFLTGYNDFSYTYKALKMPDVSYVLKLENDEILIDEITKKMQLIEQKRKIKRELLLEKAKNKALEREVNSLKFKNSLYSEQSFEFCDRALLLIRFNKEQPKIEELYAYVIEIFGEDCCILQREENYILSVFAGESEKIIAEKSRRLQQTLFEISENSSVFLLSYPEKIGDLVRYNALLKALKNFNSTDGLYFYSLKQSDKLSQEQEDRDGLIIEKVINYIKQNLSKNLSLTILSELVYYNPAYLSRKFKQVTGVNLKDYILDKRIELAKKLLIESNTFIKDVAEDCGFSNPTQFGVVFMKKTGISPTTYRLKNQ